MKPLQGRRAIVTGGGSGIGLAIAHRLIQDGASVVVLGRNKEKLANAAKDVGATAVPCDVTDPAAVGSAFDTACADGPCDILVNNAGAALSKPFLKTELDDWRALLDVNLTGAFLCTKAAIAEMARRDYGRIINVASTAGLRGYPYVSAYVAAKHGVIGLTRALALEFAASKLTVNAICPGFTETDLVAHAVEKVAETTGRTRGDALREFIKYNPQGRLVQPEEVASAAAWLCSDEAAAATGLSIPIAGGEVM